MLTRHLRGVQCSMMTRLTKVLFGAAALLAAAGSSAQITVTFERVAGTGDPVPGFNPPLDTIFNGRAFQSTGAGVLSKPCINGDGDVVFRGVSSRSDNFNFNVTTGIFGWTPGGPAVRLVAEQYTNSTGATFSGIAYPVPGRPAGTKFSNFSPPLLNDRGDVVFRASWSGPGGSGSGFYATTLAGGAITKIIDTTDAVPGYPGTLFATGGFAFDSVNSNNMLIALNNVGQVAFVGVFMRSGDSFFQIGVYGSDVSGAPAVRLADSTGVVLPIGEASNTFREVNSNASPAINDNGDVLFIGAVGTSSFSVLRGIFTAPVTGGTPRRLARQSLAAPLLHDGFARSYFSLWGAYDINNSGRYVFQHSFGAGAGAVNAVFKGTLPSPPTSPNGVVADSVLPGLGGMQVPGRALTADFTDFTGAILNDPPVSKPTRLALQSRDNGSANGQGVYSGDFAAMFTNLNPFDEVAQTPDVPPGRAVPSALQNFDSRGATINETGNMALIPSATTGATGTPPNDSVFGLYFFDDCGNTLYRVFDRDTSGPGLPAGLGKTFASSGCSGSPCERDVLIWNGFETRHGYYRSMNDNNDVAFMVAFSTFDVAIYVAHIQVSGGVLTISCPPDVTQECPGDTRTLVTGSPVVSGCGAIQVSFSDAETIGACASARTISRTWTASNGTDTASCVQTISIVDTTDPVLTAPANANIECGDSTEPSNTGQATATDTCDGEPDVSYSDIESIGTCSNQRIITRTWTATDACGNTATAQQIISVGDTQLAVLSVPPSVTISCSQSSAPAQTGQATAVDACDANPSVTYADQVTPGICPQESTIVRTWTATDACGNTVSNTQTITVVDDTPPTLTVPADVTLDCSNSGGTASAGTATAVDACDPNPSVTSSDTVTAGSCVGQRTIVRTWTAVDACGNSVSAAQTITLSDTTAPTLTPPPDVTVECGGSTNPGATGTASAVDTCDASPSVSHSDSETAGGCPQEKTIQRTWTASDGCGNSASAVQTITVQDTQPPVLTVPANVTLHCGQSTAPAMTGEATAVDTCDPAPAVTFADVQGAGGCAQASTITRTWTARDACGNSTSAVQIIQLLDTDAPTLVVPANVSIACGSSTDPSATGQATASDACDALAHVSYSDTVQAGHCPAESIITRTWTATDACNNTVSGVQTISVSDTQAPIFTNPPANRTVQCDTSTNAAALASWLAGVTASDACSSVTLTNNYHGMTTTCGAAGSTSVTWTATDACGNSTSASATFTVVDNVPPVFVVPPADRTVECDGNGNIVELADWLSSPVVHDSCGAVTLTNNFTCLNETCDLTGFATVRWTATDGCGNSSTATATFRIVDTTPPSLQCPPNIVVTAERGRCYRRNVRIGWATAGDTCSSVRVCNNAPSVFPVGTTVVTWTATDACGRSTTCQQTVTVEDTTPPDLWVSVCETMLWPANHDLIDVGLHICLDDSCDDGVEPVITVYADEDDEEATGDGVHSPDAKIWCGDQLRLRAERKGTGNGRVYLLVVSATDSSGNTSYDLSTVVVPKSRSRADLNAVLNQAAAAHAYFECFDAPPPGFVLVGDGSIIGPKQ
jgi:hypothetical protein